MGHRHSGPHAAVPGATRARQTCGTPRPERRGALDQPSTPAQCSRGAPRQTGPHYHAGAAGRCALATHCGMHLSWHHNQPKRCCQQRLGTRRSGARAGNGAGRRAGALAGALVAQHDVAPRQRQPRGHGFARADVHAHAQHRGDEELVAGRAHVGVVVLCARAEHGRAHSLCAWCCGSAGRAKHAWPVCSRRACSGGGALQSISRTQERKLCKSG